jgi:hypothetical protein
VKRRRHVELDAGAVRGWMIDVHRAIADGFEGLREAVAPEPPEPGSYYFIGETLVARGVSGPIPIAHLSELVPA